MVLMLLTDGHFLTIRQSFWQRGEHIFVKRHIRTPNSLSSELDGMLELAVIDLPEGSEKALTTEVSKLLVVPIYKTFWDVLESEDRCWQALLRPPRFSRPHHATIVTGQPGVGQCAIAHIFYNFELLDLIHQESQSF